MPATSLHALLSAADRRNLRAGITGMGGNVLALFAEIDGVPIFISLGEDGTETGDTFTVCADWDDAPDHLRSPDSSQRVHDADAVIVAAIDQVQQWSWDGHVMVRGTVHDAVGREAIDWSTDRTVRRLYCPSCGDYLYWDRLTHPLSNLLRTEEEGQICRHHDRITTFWRRVDRLHY